MPVARTVRAVLFDLDGTIADTHGLIMASYNYAIHEHLGAPALKEIWEARIGLPLEDILRATYLHYNRPAPTSEQLDAVKETYRSYMRENDERIQAFPDILEVLAGLRNSGCKLGIVTTKHRTMALRHLDKIGATDFFESEAIVCGDMSPRYKPAPDPFYLALKVLHLQAAEAAMVGDSRQDILGAKAAGVLSVAACWGTDNRKDLLDAGPDLVVESPSEVLGLVLKM